jgi:hypothetical protein
MSRIPTIFAAGRSHQPGVWPLHKQKQVEQDSVACMPAPFASSLLGWRSPKGSNKFIANCADSDNPESIRIAEGMLSAMGLNPESEKTPPPHPGIQLENQVRDDVYQSLKLADPTRIWVVGRNRAISEFSQYSHLQRVDQIVRRSAELRIAIGRDYAIKPDVTVGILNASTPKGEPFLHAAISCKWTIRSDRVQNIRHEFNQMIRHRRGRQPHLITITAEPLPSRLASIARGTGEVDCVYHIALDALMTSVASYANAAQRDALHECVQQQRLLPYEALVETLMRS